MANAENDVTGTIASTSDIIESDDYKFYNQLMLLMHQHVKAAHTLSTAIPAAGRKTTFIDVFQSGGSIVAQHRIKKVRAFKRAVKQFMVRQREGVTSGSQVSATSINALARQHQQDGRMSSLPGSRE